MSNQIVVFIDLNLFIMKKLNSAYQETFNYCITMLRSFLKKGDVSFDEVYSFARKHKLKYASA